MFRNSDSMDIVPPQRGCGIILRAGSRAGNPCDGECRPDEWLCGHHMDRFIMFWWADHWAYEFVQYHPMDRRAYYQLLQPDVPYNFEDQVFQRPKSEYMEWAKAVDLTTKCCARVESGKRRGKTCGDMTFELSETFCRHHMENWLRIIWDNMLKPNYLEKTEEEKRILHMRFLRCTYV